MNRQVIVDGMKRRLIAFIGLTVVAAVAVYQPLWELLRDAGRSDYYSHILLIPIVSAYFFYAERKKILAEVIPNPWLGGAIMVVGVLLYALGRTLRIPLGQNDYASLVTFSAIVFWWGSFLLVFGRQAFRAGLFPLLFMLFFVPVPWFLLRRVIHVLQVGSTEMVHALFWLTDTPFLRNGFIFRLPGVSIEVAEQCSGIRSSMALFITGVVAGHLFLNSSWKKLVLFATVWPITVFKNAIRIITLTFLAIHVDMGFLTGGFLHQSGGFIFYIPALCLLGGVIWLLRKEKSR